MIPDGREIASSLHGAWRLLHMDRGAMRHFTVSVEGFWRSFFAAVLAIPYYALALPWGGAGEDDAALDGGTAAIVVTTIVLSWIAYPLVLAGIARWLDMRRNYVGYVIAHNWSSALVAQALFLLLVLLELGLVGAETYGLMQLGLLLGVLWYAWVVARIAGGAGILTACGLVLLAQLLDLLIVLLLLGPPEAA